ncbi:MAG: hypothetical protein ACYCSJ_01560, partial [Acidimicrobiales bacterium]
MSGRRAGPALIVLLALVAACSSSRPVSAPRRPASPPRIVAFSEPYQLPAPLSRAVAVSAGGAIRIMGGLTAGQSTVSGVFDLDPRTGHLSPAGQLAVGVHDAAAVSLGGSALVFGGGSPNTVATAQSFGTAGGQVIGTLPKPRSDLSAVVLGGRAYILGGYDGSTGDPSILATSDGRSFATVGQLAQPVRYAAVAAAGGLIYLFGGTTPSGSSQTTLIQEFDPRSGRTRIVGHLPEPWAHGMAATVGGQIYLLGGVSGTTTLTSIWRYAPGANRATLTPDVLPYPVSDASVTQVGEATFLVGGELSGNPVTGVTSVRPAGGAAQVSSSAAQGAPFTGHLLIADRGNNRLILVNPAKAILWTYPSASAPAPPGGFYFPDDAFFARKGTEIISNEEENNTIVQIAYPSGKILWSYGHPRLPGSAAGYLDQPDDAYLLKDGTITVADALNCRILFIDPSGVPSGQIGATGNCVHNPPASLGYPNGDTPLANGDFLISEIHGSWVSEYTRTGNLVWTVQLPIGYPSDPQQIGPDLYLIADYSNPGGIYEFNRAGDILWSYHVISGDGMLDHPSLAERLPNGLIGVNDDYRDRVLLIDPVNDRIVWQYGQ